MKWLTRDEEGGGPEGRARWIRPTGPAPRPSRRERLFDFILAFCVAVPMKPERAYTFHIPGYANILAPKSMMIAAALGVFVSLSIRRRLPLVGLALLLLELNFFRVPFIMVGVAVLIASYSAATYSPYRRLSLAALPISCVELWKYGYFLLLPDRKLLTLPIAVPLLIGVALYGSEIRKQAATDVATRQRTREEKHQEAIRLAVEAERSRIARDLHDIVTHNVSVMVVMAGAARKTLQRDPEQATQALLEVESAGRAAMTELRQVMGLLTESARAQHQLAPQPGLDQLEPLVSRIRATGVPIAYRVLGEPRSLPPGLDLTAYRVVQEALTNTVKHASGASVDILVDYKPTRLGLDIADSGGAPGQSAASGNGRGLIGLRERVAVHGGIVRAGPRAQGGYRVRVEIPLPVEDAV
ncbi:sensor histidine kinase [Actinospica sp.]|uniref:sensor histidine kinase n=1 Tax=Actinospica sp. TaxID=1872142 RepID=UPI0032C222A4